MKEHLKKIPEFTNEEEEREFWDKHDSTEYIDYKKAGKVVFPELQMSTRVISLRLTESMLNEIKSLAHKNDIPYQTYIKVLLLEQLKRNRLKKAS
ncbi:MAG: BrnA antitoxin family protein [Oligoflexia bacterium]|nr:BrnA antitoxin family protein [Oligoflexia bacterium]